MKFESQTLFLRAGCKCRQNMISSSEVETNEPLSTTQSLFCGAKARGAMSTSNVKVDRSLLLTKWTSAERRISLKYEYVHRTPVRHLPTCWQPKTACSVMCQEACRCLHIAIAPNKLSRMTLMHMNSVQLSKASRAAVWPGSTRVLMFPTARF